LRHKIFPARRQNDGCLRGCGKGSEITRYYLRLPHINRLERHGAEAIYSAVDVVVAVGESYIFHLGACLDGFGSALYREILDQDNSISILQNDAVCIFYDQCLKSVSFRRDRFFRIPFVATLRAHHGCAGGVAVGGLASGTMI